MVSFGLDGLGLGLNGLDLDFICGLDFVTIESDCGFDLLPKKIVLPTGKMF